MRSSRLREALSALDGADQVPQGLLRPAPQLTPEQQRNEPAPPPGREMEVSIEAEQSPTFRGRGESQMLVVVDAER